MTRLRFYSPGVAKATTSKSICTRPIVNTIQSTRKVASDDSLFRKERPLGHGCGLGLAGLHVPVTGLRVAHQSGHKRLDSRDWIPHGHAALRRLKASCAFDNHPDTRILSEPGSARWGRLSSEEPTPSSYSLDGTARFFPRCTSLPKPPLFTGVGASSDSVLA